MGAGIAWGQHACGGERTEMQSEQLMGLLDTIIIIIIIIITSMTQNHNRVCNCRINTEICVVR